MIERRTDKRETLLQIVRYAPSPETSDTVLRGMIKDWSLSGLCLKVLQSFFILILLCFLMTACEQKPKNPVSEYGDTMIDAYRKGQQAGVTANLDAVKKAVAAYHASNDRYPPSLADVKDLIGSDIDFAQYDYNPENGTVSLKKRRN